MEYTQIEKEQIADTYITSWPLITAEQNAVRH